MNFTSINFLALKKTLNCWMQSVVSIYAITIDHPKFVAEDF